MKIPITLALLAGVIGVSLGTGELNIPLLVSGAICTLFLFLAVTQVEKTREINQHTKATEMKELLEITNKQFQVQTLTNQQLELVTKQIVNLSDIVKQNHDEQLKIGKEEQIEMIDVLNHGAEHLQTAILSIITEQIEFSNQFKNSLSDAEKEIHQVVRRVVENHTKIQSGILEERTHQQAELLIDISSAIVELNRQLKEVDKNQTQKGQELIKELQPIINLIVEGVAKNHDLQENIIVGIEKNHGLQENLIYEINENEKVISSLVDQLMGISTEMAESKDLARERIIHMQERLTKELKAGQKMKA